MKLGEAAKYSTIGAFVIALLTFWFQISPKSNNDLQDFTQDQSEAEKNNQQIEQSISEVEAKHPNVDQVNQSPDNYTGNSKASISESKPVAQTQIDDRSNDNKKNNIADPIKVEESKSVQTNLHDCEARNYGTGSFVNFNDFTVRIYFPSLARVNSNSYSEVNIQPGDTGVVKFVKPGIYTFIASASSPQTTGNWWQQSGELDIEECQTAMIKIKK